MFSPAQIFLFPSSFVFFLPFLSMACCFSSFFFSLSYFDSSLKHYCILSFSYSLLLSFCPSLLSLFSTFFSSYFLYSFHSSLKVYCIISFLHSLLPPSRPSHLPFPLPFSSSYLLSSFPSGNILSTLLSPSELSPPLRITHTPPTSTLIIRACHPPSLPAPKFPTWTCR